MERSARFVLRHRRWVVVLWLAVLVAGGFAAGRLGDRLSFDFSLPGQPGYETELRLMESYGSAAYPGFVPAFTAPEGETIAEHADDVTAVSEALRAFPGVRVVDHGSTGDPDFVTADGRTAFALVYTPEVPGGGFEGPSEQIGATIREVAAQRGLSVSITGYDQLMAGNEEPEGPSVLVETLIGALGALVVLVFVFASFLALVPLAVAAVSILSTFLIVLGLTAITDVSFIVQFLIALVGLGVAIDYSLLIVSRWREERARGAANDDAVVTAVRTAGHAVLASGVTVAISLLALIVLPVPMLRSMGYGGMLIPLMSVLVVLTLLPAMLGSIGPRVDWPRIRTERRESRAWAAWGRLVVRRRWSAATVAGALLALAIIPVAGLQIGMTGSESLASNGEARQTLDRLADGGIGSGVLTPIVALVEPGGDADAVATAARTVEGVQAAAVEAPAPDGMRAVTIVPVDESADNNSVAVVDAVRDAVADVPGFVGLAGQGPVVQDFTAAVYGNFPLVLLAIALVTFVLLVRTFRSLLLPLKAVLLNLVSVAAVFGLATWFWQEGNGSEAVFGVTETGAMTFWVPVMIFAFLFGLSMDYEVFILSRMREEYDRTGSTTYAVTHGLARTGRLVTSAALILFFAFAALASSPETDIKVLATALGAGILIDATIVRALLVPALVAVLGRWNWWLPVPVARLLRVEPSPLRREVPVAGPGPADEREPVAVG